MRINNGYNDPRANQAQSADKTQETAATGQAKAARAGAGVSGAGDEVNLSNLASVLQSALSDSPARSAYLEKLSADFANQSFQPDSQATARGIIDDATERKKL